MAADGMSLLEILREVSGEGERDPDRRLTCRNGYRERRWDTRVGTIPLDVPRVRDGGHPPSPLDPGVARSGPCSRPPGRRARPASAPAGRTTWSAPWGSPASAGAR